MNKEYLNECFSYCRSTGTLTWASRPLNHFKTEHGWKVFLSQRVGKVAGCISDSGDGRLYLKVGVNKKLYFCHRLIWVMVYGDIPDGMEIDHINGDGTDNRLDNLRLVTSSGNKKNRALGSDNKSGYHGIYWNREMKKWVCQAWSDGVYLGSSSHATLDAAVSARAEMIRGFGFHENHGRERSKSL